jgi:Flp pilus assembly pilin Flp
MLRRWKDFLLAEDGQDLVEYALLAALVSIASVVALRSLGPVVAGLFDQVTAAFA